MQKLHQKLHSQRGTSMLIALLFFLTCLTLGSLILTAASANAAKTRGRYENQQDYLAVASAARLLRDTLGRSTYTTGWDLVTWTDEETKEERSAREQIAPITAPAAGDLLIDAFVALGSNPAGYTQTFPVQAQEMPVVQAQLAMQPGGDAAFALTCGSHSITVSFTARTAQTTDHISYARFITSWSAGAIAKGAD